MGANRKIIRRHNKMQQGAIKLCDTGVEFNGCKVLLVSDDPNNGANFKGWLNWCAGRARIPNMHDIVNEHIRGMAAAQERAEKGERLN